MRISPLDDAMLMHGSNRLLWHPFSPSVLTHSLGQLVPSNAEHLAIASALKTPGRAGPKGGPRSARPVGPKPGPGRAWPRVGPDHGANGEHVRNGTVKRTTVTNHHRGLHCYR